MKAELLCFALVLSAAVPSVALAQGVEGHYRFRVLSAERDSTIAEGEVVVFHQALDPTELSADMINRAQRESRWLLMGDADITICFAVASSPRYVQGREFYPGIIENGVSSWSINPEGQILLRLYQSPDASASVVGTLEGSWMQGGASSS